MSNLTQRIEEILTGVYSTDHDAMQAGQDYAESFQREGSRKAKFVIDRINDLDEQTWESLEDHVALSVGGSDGSDLLALVKATPIRDSILLEQDEKAADFATEHTKPLIEAEGGTFRVVVGDAAKKLDSIVKMLETKKGKGANGLVCLFFGVLHELPRRSEGFELGHYISRLASVFERNLFFLSEPCLPPHEDKQVEVRVSKISEDRLFELLDHINVHLFNDQCQLRKMSKGFVRADFALVMEMLHKLLRSETIPRFRHEMNEQLTQFSSKEFLQALKTHLPDATVEKTERVSEGFHRAFQESDVELRTIKGQKLDLPFSHVRISAISPATLRGKQKQRQVQGKVDQHFKEKREQSKEESESSTDFNYAESSLADVDFPMPSDDPVTAIIRDLRSCNWYKQSPAIEKVFTKLRWSEWNEDQTFVLGRNIYQCAEGDENRAKDIMNNLRRELARIPDESSVHILNGMFYEAYFDSEGKFRDGKLKDKYLTQLFSMEASKKFARCIDFIRAVLAPYRDRLGILPGEPKEVLKVKLRLDIDEDPPLIMSIKCRGVEQMVPSVADDADPAWEISYRPISTDKFELKLRKFWCIPEGRLEVTFDQDTSEIEKIRMPDNKTVRRLRT